MTWARKRWTSRVFAAVLILSMLPTLIVPTSRAVRDVQLDSYESWIRAQLRIPVEGAVENALSHAVESDAESFDQFIAAFIHAYAEAAPGQPISQVFTDRDLSDDALISFLQRRYSQIAAEGVLPRLYVTSFVPNVAVGGKSGLAAALTTAGASAVVDSDAFTATIVERTVVISFRILSSARSLGP